MKTPSQDLFELIRSLSGSEKRFFALHSGLHGGDKKYMKLFRAIDAQERYDEKAIKVMFRGEKFIRQLTFTKDYLYRAILGSLVKYHERSAADLELLRQVCDAQVLMMKGLTGQCLKMIGKARKKAEVSEKYALLMEVLDLERKLHMREHLLISSEKILDEIRAVEVRNLGLLDELCIFRNLYAAMQREGIKNWRPRTPEERMPFRKITGHPLLKKKKPPAGFEARYYYHHIHGMSHYFHRRLGKAEQFLQKAADLLAGRPEFIADSPDRYIAALSNIALTQIQAEHMRDAWNTLEAMKRQFTGSRLRPEAEARYLANYSIYSLNICLNTARYGQGERIIEEMQREMERLGGYVTDEARIVFAFNASVLCFILGRHNNALRWLNTIYGIELAGKVRLDLATFIRIFDLVIHIELDNQDLLAYKLRSVYRYLAGRKRLLAFEATILDIMRRQMKVHTKKEEKVVYLYARERLTDLNKKPYEREALDRFDFIGWIDSKLAGTSFRDITAARALPF